MKLNLTAEEITEGNNLIEMFNDRSEPLYDVNKFIYAWHFPSGIIMNHTELTYHQYWDSLMPVLARIGDLNGQCRNADLWNRVVLYLTSLDIEWTFRGVVEYIKWFDANYDLWD